MGGVKTRLNFAILVKEEVCRDIYVKDVRRNLNIKGDHNNFKE